VNKNHDDPRKIERDWVSQLRKAEYRLSKEERRRELPYRRDVRGSRRAG